MTEFLFEDFTQSRVFDLGAEILDAERMRAFACDYDPQPFHLDAEMAKPIFGGLIASGWQTASLFQKHLVEALLLNTQSLGSPGVEKLRFLKPVFAGDDLAFRATVASARGSSSRPEVGIVVLNGEVVCRSETVLDLQGTIMVRRSSDR